MRLRIPKILKRLGTVLVLALVVEYLLLPQVAGARKSVHLLSDANLWLVPVGVALEVASLMAYARLTQVLLPRGTLRFNTAFRITLATLSVSHMVPGGTAAGAGLGYRLLRTAGASRHDVGFALATQGIGSAAVLNVILWVALIVSIPLYGFNPLYGTAAVLGVLLIGFIATLVVLLTKGEEKAAVLLKAIARRVPFLSEETIEPLLRLVASRLRELTVDRRLLVRTVSWAAANWLLDAASLWVFVAAFGSATNPDALLVSYGLANVLAAIPVTPAGLGVVEGILVPTLVGFGTTKGVAILGVLGWRMVNFWLPIPVGAAAYVSLRVGPGGLLGPEELRRLAEEEPMTDPHGARLDLRDGVEPPPPATPVPPARRRPG